MQHLSQVSLQENGYPLELPEDEVITIRAKQGEFPYENRRNSPFPIFQGEFIKGKSTHYHMGNFTLWEFHPIKGLNYMGFLVWWIFALIYGEIQHVKLLAKN